MATESSMIDEVSMQGNLACPSTREIPSGGIEAMICYPQARVGPSVDASINHTQVYEFARDGEFPTAMQALENASKVKP